MKVVVTQPVPASSLDRLLAAGLDVTGPLADGPLPAADLAAGAAGAEALLCQLTDPVTAEVITAVPTLRLISTIAAGFNNIDIAAAAAAGVTVTNTPGVLTDATADLTLALLLAVARRIPEGDAAMRAGEFTGWRLMQEPMGLTVTGQTLGIIGMGRIGLAVARRCALGFGMTVLYSGGSPAATETAAIGAVEVPLDELLARADFVSLHAPVTPATHHLIDARRLALMKPTAVLLNTARGSLVVEADLVEALENGVIGGAGLDVFEFEPAVGAALLACAARVVLTPHVGSLTLDTRLAMAAMAADAILDVAAGRPVRHPVLPRETVPA